VSDGCSTTSESTGAREPQRVLDEGCKRTLGGIGVLQLGLGAAVDLVDDVDLLVVHGVVTLGKQAPVELVGL